MAGEREDSAVGGTQASGSVPFDQLMPARIHKISDTLEDVARIMLGEAYGLGFTETRILAFLGENKTASVADLSRDLRIDKAWISRRLQSLATKKLITKNRDEADSRAVLVALTSKGRSFAEQAMKVVQETYQIIMSDIDEPAANDFVTKLESNLATILKRLATEQKPAIEPTRISKA